MQSLKIRNNANCGILVHYLRCFLVFILSLDTFLFILYRLKFWSLVVYMTKNEIVIPVN
jgi:hypothetical protein